MSKPSEPAVLESRLAELCRGLAEAVWLAALMGVPLLFEPRAVNCGYQPYKLGLFRALALIGLAAWLVHAMETSGGPRILAGLRRHRLVQALVALALAVVVSTACSVEWQSSLWGAYETAQGAVTWAAGLALLGMIAWFLRTREQAERVVTTLLVTSFAIALMSLLQRAGYDPQVLFFGGSRAFGSMGNPIYLGGYLLMVVPLTLARLVAVRSRWQRVFYGLVLLSQLAALYFTLSRGPLLGLLSGVFAFAALYVTRRGMVRCQLLLGGLAVSVCVLALAGLAFASTQRMQGAGDPSVAIPLVGGDSGRSTFWSYAPKILAGSQPLQLPDGGQDRLAGLRLWLGHGLDTLDRVIPQHRVSGDSAAVENRFHNLVLDHGYTMGLMGLGAFLTVLVLAFHGGFQALGLIPTRSVAKGFWICTLGASAVVCALAVLTLGPGFVGLGCVLGLGAGLLLFAVWAPRFATLALPAAAPADDAWLVVALLSALIGHLVDMAFAFETAATFVLLFLYLGLLLALRRGLISSSQSVALPSLPLPKKARKQGRTAKPATALVDWRQALANPLLVAFGLVTMLFALTHQYSFETFTAADLLSFSLLNLKGVQGHYSLMILPVLALWAAGCLLPGAEEKSPASTLNRRLLALLVSAIAALVYALFESAQLAGIGPLPRRAAEVSDVLAQAQGYADVYLRSMLWLLALVLLAGGCLGKAPVTAVATSLRGWIAAGLALVAVVAGLGPLALQPLRTDVIAQWGMALETFGRTRLATEMYAAASQGNPRVFAYRAMLVDNLLRDADAAANPQEARALLQRAELIMLDAQRWSGLNRSSYYLGQIYRQMALQETTPTASPEAVKAADVFAQARRVEPLWESVWRESALVDLLVQGSTMAATAKLAKAKTLGQSAALFWAEHYAGKASQTRQPKVASHYTNAALEYFDVALQQSVDQADLMARIHSGKGSLLLASGRFLEAVPSLLEALKYEGLDQRWQVELRLVQAYLQLSDPDQAKLHLEQALKHVPPDQREALRPFQAALGMP